MITSVNNQTIKEISLLLKKGKERKKQDIFVAEGIRMFTEIPKKQMIKAFVSESFLQTKEDRVLDGIDYEVVSDSVFKEISDTKTPQGILALVKQFHYTIEEILEKKPFIVIGGYSRSRKFRQHIKSRRRGWNHRCDYVKGDSGYL